MRAAQADSGGAPPENRPVKFKTKLSAPGAKALLDLPAAQTPQRSGRERKGLARGQWQYLYDGRDLLGITEKSADGNWHALDRNGKPLGVFASRSEAIARIGESLRRGGR